MKDFDEARAARAATERTFKIGGIDFTYRQSVAPEVLIHWNEAVTEVTKLDERGWLNLFDETIVALLEPGQEQQWRDLRATNAADPLNIADIREVLKWLIEQATGRPTGEPSGSSAGSATTVTALKDVSSPPAEASTA